MARIDINIDELHHFGRTLHGFRERIRSERLALNGRIEHAKSFWRDDERSIFAARYSEIELEIQLFERDCERYLDYLARKERALRAARGLH